MNAPTPTSLLHPLTAQILDFQEDEHDYHFQIEYPDPENCHTCGTIGQVVRFGKKQVKYRDVPLRGKRVSLWAIQRRFLCRSCGGTFTPKFWEMTDDHRMTKRCYSYIIKQAVAGANTKVARDIGFDESVVRAVIKAYCEEKASGYRPTLPRVLGIDELYLGRKFRCVLTDIERSTIIDVLEDREFSVVHNYLANARGRENVQIVCQDMWKPYRMVASQLFPKASVVVDKFHIQRGANLCLDELRKHVKKGLPKAKRRQLTQDRKLMLMRRHDLDEWQKMQIDTWLNKVPEFGAIYEGKEAFFDIWLSTSEEEARKRYREWLDAIPEDHQSYWKPLITSMTNWDKEIFAYFGPAERNTNAYTESINRQMRDLHRDTRGMSFEMFRAKTLFSLEHKVTKPKPKRESPFAMKRLFTMDESEMPIDHGVPIEAVLRAIQAEQ